MPNKKRTAVTAAGIVLAGALVSFAVWPRMFEAGTPVVNVYCTRRDFCRRGLRRIHSPDGDQGRHYLRHGSDEVAVAGRSAQARARASAVRRVLEQRAGRHHGPGPPRRAGYVQGKRLRANSRSLQRRRRPLGRVRGTDAGLDREHQSDAARAREGRNVFQRPSRTLRDGQSAVRDDADAVQHPVAVARARVREDLAGRSETAGLA